MKLFVKTLKGNHFQIQVKPQDTVGDVKKIIESVQGANVYPVSQQMLIYQGKALIDGTTLDENKVAENSFIVVMLLTRKSLSGNGSVASTAMPTSKGLAIPESPVEASTTSSTIVTDASPPASTPNSMSSTNTLAEGSTPELLRAPKSLTEASTHESLPAPKSLSEASTSSLKPVTITSRSASTPAKLPSPKSPAVASTSPSSILTSGSSCTSKRTKLPTPKSPVEASTSSSRTVTNPSPAASTPKMPAAPTIASSVLESDIVGKAASHLAAPNGLESTIQHILDMGGGIWDRDTVVSALRAASNDPERAIDYLYSGIPKQDEVPSHAQSKGARHPTNTSTVSQPPTRPVSVPSSRPNAGPSDIFPLAFLHLGSDAAPTGALDFLRNSEQFQVLRAMVRANPEVLEPMLKELGKQNPNLMRLIREHQTDFHRLLKEPVEDEGNILGQFSAAMPQAIQVTPEEHAAIERLEAMGFERSTVLEAYFACNKNEELTANYLLDHMHEL